MAKRFYQLKKFDMIHVPNLVVKCRPYLYCTKKEKQGGAHHPDADVKIVADLWIVTGTGSHGSWNRKSIGTTRIPRCTIDVKAGRVYRNSDGEEIEIANLDDLVRIVQKEVFVGREEETVR